MSWELWYNHLRYKGNDELIKKYEEAQVSIYAVRSIKEYWYRMDYPFYTQPFGRNISFIEYVPHPLEIELQNRLQIAQEAMFDLDQEDQQEQILLKIKELRTKLWQRAWQTPRHP